jgi:hypothetical protein
MRKGEVIVTYIVYFNTSIFADRIAPNSRMIYKRWIEKNMAAVVACFKASL